MSPDDELRSIVRCHGRAVERYLRALEMDTEAREELWSDVFTVAFRRLDHLSGLEEPQVRRWLIATARNVTANGARRALARRRLVERLSREPAGRIPSAEDQYVSSVPEADRLRVAWSSLRFEHQQVLTLQINGSDGKVIAAQLGITHQAARSRLMRARAAFLDAYERDGAM
jgi:DNA-directed RNA polymerase specialized sigma24 family protein